MSTPRALRELQDTLAKRYPDVTVHLRLRSGVVVLALLSVPRHMRRRGLGTRVLEQLCSWSDRTRTTLALTPDGAFGTEPRALVAWYGRHGFVVGEMAGQRMYRHARVGLGEVAAAHMAKR